MERECERGRVHTTERNEVKWDEQIVPLTAEDTTTTRAAPIHPSLMTVGLGTVWCL